jgi:hypothetical protein
MQTTHNVSEYYHERGLRQNEEKKTKQITSTQKCPVVVLGNTIAEPLRNHGNEILMKEVPRF